MMSPTVNFSHYGHESLGFNDNANGGRDDMFRTMANNPIGQTTMFFLGGDDGTSSSKLSVAIGVESEGIIGVF